MDPRPFHFEYRRPRPSNPTFESSHLYESLLTLKDNNQARKLSFRIQPKNPEQKAVNKTYSQQVQPEMKRANSTDLNSKKMPELSGLASHRDRYASKDSLPVKEGDGRSKIAGIGNTLLRNSTMDQTQIYNRQQKEFNIINFYPKEYKPNLKQFPKFSLEHRLLDTKKANLN